jgi:hypothetical protein
LNKVQPPSKIQPPLAKNICDCLGSLLLGWPQPSTWQCFLLVVAPRSLCTFTASVLVLGLGLDRLLMMARPLVYSRLKGSGYLATWLHIPWMHHIARSLFGGDLGRRGIKSHRGGG